MSGEVRIEAEIDTNGAGKYLDKLLEKSSLEIFSHLEEMLARSFLDCEAKVHIETGSLKSTGKPLSAATPEEWTGEVRFGGAAPGMPRDPAFYGVFELARGGRHFFLEPAYRQMGGKAAQEMVMDFLRRT